MSEDLIAFVTVRLDEDEAAAKAAHPGPWILEEHAGGFGPAAWISVPFGHGMPNAKSGLTAFVPLGTQDAGTIRHIARHDPARVLREVEAKRAIVADLIRRADRLQADLDDTWFPKIFRQLAVAWSGHLDYRPEWKP